ncbi:hypothetical protein ACN47E_010308 [Coniothyrium glycines]
MAETSHEKNPVTQIRQTESETTDAASQHRTSRSAWSLVREWQWELISWLFGTAALVAIILLLIVFKDKPLTNWNARLPPNTIIAIISQVAQSALLFSISSCIGQLKWSWLRKERSAADIDKFEAASHGPRGSLELLLTTHPTLVSIGALATILLLGFNPFVQQAATIGIRTVEYEDPSSIAAIRRTVQYVNDNFATQLSDHNATSTASDGSIGGVSTFHPNMVKGILSGILGETHLADIVGYCNAEACEWPLYTTLAICATSEEVSSLGSVSNHTVGEQGVPVFSINGTDWVPPTVYLTEPDTFWMKSQLHDPEILEQDKLPSLADIYVAYLPMCDGVGETIPNWRERVNTASEWRAYKGTLNLCLQTLKSDMNTTMSTEIISTQTDLSWKKINPNNSSSILCLTAPQGKDEFCVGGNDLLQWASQMAFYFNGAASLTAHDAGQNYYAGAWVPNILNDVLGEDRSVCAGTAPPEFNGFEQRMQYIATSMTNAMRESDKAENVVGVKQKQVQYINVTFAWLSLPIAIYIIITIFLFITFVKSREAHTPLWKSSPLVLLQATNRENEMGKVEHVEENAKKTFVQLKYTGETWHLEDVTNRRA